MRAKDIALKINRTATYSRQRLSELLGVEQPTVLRMVRNGMLPKPDNAGKWTGEELYHFHNQKHLRAMGLLAVPKPKTKRKRKAATA